LFAKNEKNQWRYIVSGEAPTTVEAPSEDVTLGVVNAVKEIEELTGHRILLQNRQGIIQPCTGHVGVDLYCTTSSAGGGLQMMVAGVIKTMTAESANRAALGAGAIVMDLIALDDGRRPYEKIRRIRNLRPDMILLAGGIDGVMMIAELIRAANPKPRLGAGYRLPLIYAGNREIREQIRKTLEANFSVTVVENLRPVLEMENTEPARQAIHEMFMEHVMSHAPGYSKLSGWTGVDIMPTPAAEGIAMQLIAKTFDMNVLGVGLGGATTNVYSVVNGRFVRSVSANLGMSYSVCNVMKESGVKNIMRWLPFKMNQDDLRSRLRNKMIRPTTIPQKMDELIMEHAVAREALRLGLLHHKSIASRLKGVKISRTIGDLFQQEAEESYIDMMKIQIIASTGGLLSHAPMREQTMLILIDAFQPEGITRMFQDSVFMMPHLGVLSTIYPEAAWEIFDKDCLVRLGTVIAPRGNASAGEKVMSVKLERPDGDIVQEEVGFGEIKRIRLSTGTEGTITGQLHRGFDAGEGRGHRFEGKVMGGEVGIILDGRGRPLVLSDNEETRRKTLMEWLSSIAAYPEETLDQLQ